MKHNLINSLSHYFTNIMNRNLTIWINLTFMMTILVSIHMRNNVPKERVKKARKQEIKEKNRTNSKQQKSTKSSTLNIYLIFVLNFIKIYLYNHRSSICRSKNLVRNKSYNKLKFQKFLIFIY